MKCLDDWNMQPPLAEPFLRRALAAIDRIEAAAARIEAYADRCEANEAAERAHFAAACR